MPDRPDRRRLIDLANLLGAAGALGVSALVAVALGGAPAAPDVAAHGPSQAAAAAFLADAGGHLVPLRRYLRIASSSMVADQLLLELCEPDRVVAFSELASSLPRAHRFAGKPVLRTWAGVEEILARRPDLLIIASFARPNLVQRLREQGVAVFDLGEMRGLASVLRSMERVGALVGRPEEGARLARSFGQRLRAVARGLSQERRKGAVYLSPMGGKLLCGTRDTSFHDVLEHAGLTDLAAARYRGWPRLTAEQVLALAPEVIVTREGAGAALCTEPGFDGLRPCRRAGALVEVPGALVNDPGMSMLPAAEWIFERVHGTHR